jgi:alkanesulfonate monooxygenase SsuD/methylene tetrahydromethanopterin reductase-like flavin-dependent oxidoreductase (luciferase family)
MRFSVAMVVCCGADTAELSRRASAIGRDLSELRVHGAAGTPAEVAGRLRSWEEAGAETAYLQVLDLADLDHLRLIAREVAPQVGWEGAVEPGPNRR